MTRKLTLDETIVVRRSIEEAFAYVADLSRIEEWDPAVSRGTKLSDGAPGVGSEYRIDMRGGFSLHYTVVEFEQNARMQMDVASRFCTSREEIFFDATDDGTRIRYVADFDFIAPLAVFSKLFPGPLQRIGRSAMAGLKNALEDEFDAPEASALLAAADRLVLPGIWRFTSLGYRESKKRFKPVSAYQGDRHAIVTGATSGIGEAIARQLADLGARVTIVARSEEKASRIVDELITETGNERIGYETADLAIMADVHALCNRLLEAGERIDTIVNNAGALFNPRQQTPEGFEKSFALLLLSPYVLTERLLPLMKNSESTRVVNVLSGGMYTQRIRVRDLQSTRGEYSGSVAYARAKRGLMIVTEDWAERWKKDRIVVNAMHPGWVDTPGVESALPGFYRVTKRLLRSPDEGADTAVWLATSSEAGKVSGKFWLDREQHPTHLSKRSKESPEDRRELLATLRELLESTSPGSSERRKTADA